MPKEKQVRFDVDGSEIVSKVLLELLNKCPALCGKKVAFSTLGEDEGLGFFPSVGAAITSETETITGDVHQVCAYPFDVVLRCAPKTEAARIRCKELLDAIGRWLERQSITVNGEMHTMDAYPALTEGNRKIRAISRTSPSHLNAVYQNGVEDWLFSGSLRYENNFCR
jgi:hypothetical protein